MIKIKAWRTMTKRKLFQSDEEHLQKPDANTAQRSKNLDAPLPQDAKRIAVLFTIVLAKKVRRREKTEWVE